MFLNTKGTIGELGPDMEALFSYINGGADSIGMETGSSYVDRLDGYVRELNRDKEWRMERMKYELNLAEKYEEGERAGFSMGMAEGLSKGEAAGLSKGRSGRRGAWSEASRSRVFLLRSFPRLHL